MTTKRAFIKQVQGITFAGKTDSNHWVMMDGPAGFGGNDGGTRPKELILLALAGCTGSDVVSILTKKRVPLEGFEMSGRKGLGVGRFHGERVAVGFNGPHLIG